MGSSEMKIFVPGGGVYTVCKQGGEDGCEGSPGDE